MRLEYSCLVPMKRYLRASNIGRVSVRGYYRPPSFDILPNDDDGDDNDNKDDIDDDGNDNVTAGGVTLGRPGRSTSRDGHLDWM